MKGLQKLTNALSNGTKPDPLQPSLPHKIGGPQPPPKNFNRYISGMGKAKDFKFGRYIHRFNPNKSLKSGEKGAWAYPRTAHIFKVGYPPSYLRNR